jgi:hypothetical protein
MKITIEFDSGETREFFLVGEPTHKPSLEYWVVEFEDPGVTRNEVFIARRFIKEPKP